MIRQDEVCRIAFGDEGFLWVATQGGLSRFDGEQFVGCGHLIAFSFKRRDFCPSCDTRRMVESAALLVDKVFPEQPVHQ